MEKGEYKFNFSDNHFAINRLYSFEYLFLISTFLLSFFSLQYMISNFIQSFIKPSTILITQYNNDSSSISFWLAIFITTFPVFLLLFWLDKQRVNKNKSKRFVYSRMFGIYLTLFVISIFVLFTVASFLNGLFTGSVNSTIPGLISSLIVFLYPVIYLFGEIRSFEFSQS